MVTESKSASWSSIGLTEAPAAGGDAANLDWFELEEEALIDEPGVLAQPVRGYLVTPQLDLDLVTAPEPPLRDHRREQRTADPSASVRLRDVQLADPALEGRVVEAPPEPKVDDPGSLAIDHCEQRQSIHVTDQRREGCARGGVVAPRRNCAVGADERQDRACVLTTCRPDLDAFGSWNRQPSHGPIWIPEVHWAISVR